jgi:nucleotide-binding universal stress UspA family protein
LDKVVTADDRQKVGTRVAVETGSPVTKILEYAEKHAIDLIVMGTHGRGAMERIWVGSVTEGVLQRAACPVVSVQQPRG